MGRHAGLLALSVLLLALGCLFVHAKVELRGVHPSDAALYAGQNFACKDGSKTDLPLAKVNDDYCDCADGSDEPGTSACDNGSFFCPNRGHIGRRLFSSRVNDGICDCCDGSDEFDGKAKCQDTCYALGEGTRIAKRKEIEAFKKGLEIRRQYETQAKTARVEKQKELDELRTNLAQSQQMEKDLQAQVDALEAKAQAAQELLSQYKPAEVPAPIEQEQTHEEDGNDHLLDEDEEEADEDDEDEIGDDEDDNSEEETEEAKKEEPKVLLERTDDVKEALQQAEKDVAEYKASKKSKDEGDEEGILASVWRFLGSSVSGSSSSSPLSGEATMSDLKDLRTSLRNVQRKAQDAAKDISTLESYLGLDLGEDAFYGIHDQTFELHTNEYTYKLTPFKEVKQQHTRLGEWGSWLNPEHTQMEYAGGERCWNGPDRKTVVNLTCGDVNKVLSVSEPNKCEYHMEFTTPAACSPQRLAQLEEELASLEQPGDVVIPPTNDIF